MIRMTTDTRQLKRQLQKYGDKVLPETVAATINVVATSAHNRSIHNIKKNLTLRNPYTLKSMRYYKASPRTDLRRIDAITGSISHYLPIQDTGGRIHAKRGRIAIPTKESRTAKSKARVVARRFRLDRLGQIGSGGLFIARSRRGKLGIFLRKKLRKKRVVIMLRDLSIKTRRIKPTHWHTEAVKKFATHRLMTTIFAREARKRMGIIK